MARTALHQAAVSSGERTQMRIDEGFDVNEADTDGLTPIHIASINKSYDAANVLLQAGAHVDPQDKWGNTPLNRAVFEVGAAKLVQLLIDHGADPTIANHYGHSPISEVKRYRQTDYLAILEKADPPSKDSVIEG